jgi:hypothetical protein
MNKTFHEHAIKIVTANLHRSLEYDVQEVMNDAGVPSGLFSVKVEPLRSIQQDFFGPVQWVGNFFHENPARCDDVSNSDIGRLDRAAGVHDFFPMFRNTFISDGEYCSCQYPTMQGLPCEHCFAVLVIKLQAPAIPDVFLKQTFWHIDSDETESQFQQWCKRMLWTKESLPQLKPNMPNSTAQSRYNGLMLTAKTQTGCRNKWFRCV